MTLKSNFKELLISLGFKEDGQVFSKYFSEIEVFLKADFAKKTLIYPIEKGFKINGEFTCNFAADENFVVFECVNRLFEKGYQPNHIELEPKWKLGHGASGGRADILVRDQQNEPLLLIECKTAGDEFKREWNKTLQHGGQLMSYAKQTGATKYLCLYAADFVDGKAVYFSNIISLVDNQKLLEELVDKKPLSFNEAKALEVEDIYKAWKETYLLEYATKGIFESDILPYQIGKQKYSTDDLLEVSEKDRQAKYHEFATILRAHNVSGRENAFDKLVNLFLCKIVDEEKNPKDLKFNWKGIAFDNYFDLQDRLQMLYKAGMKEFLGEEVTYIENSQIDSAFRYFKKDPDATKETIKHYFRQLKFFTNNDFAFLDVHNERLFYQNSEILLKIVRMLQDIKLRSTAHNQFLGDMFEGFLDNGVKQSEGQFFTPMPIVKFILNSLPLESVISKSELPPKAIDYACGAGHFLNELASQIQPLVEKHKKKPDPRDYYQEIVGVEKEYRLSKVAKVSAFMYGQNEIKIIYGDALGNNLGNALGDSSKLQNGEFSILVANPPYAVKGFLETLSEAERKAFSLFAKVDDKNLATNNSIEAFFIERAKQLLKPGGVAAIILPSSILSNDSALYTATRELILSFFEIIAIVEFGSQTFGKTGTNTITLFLRRKSENPSAANHFKNRVDSWFGDSEAQKKIVEIYDDEQILANYCKTIGIDLEAYKTLLASQPSAELLKNEIFIDYRKAFENLAEIRTLKRAGGAFGRRSELDQKLELNQKFVKFLQEIEKDKLLFFALASEGKRKVLVVKAPSDSKEQKKFLGYEWSSAKGNEGIKYLASQLNQSLASNQENHETDLEIPQNTSKGLDSISTPLYNPKNRSDKSKINFLIEQNFLGKELPIAEDLKGLASYNHLVDLLDFSRVSFSKTISLNPKKHSEISSKWELVKLGDVAETSSGGTPLSSRAEYYVNGLIPWINSGEVGQGEIWKAENFITEVGLKNSSAKIFPKETVLLAMYGATAGKVGILRIEACTNQAVCGILPNGKFLPKFMYLQLFSMYDYLLELRTGIARDNLSQDKIKAIKIPLPPLAVQQQIVDECGLVDKEAEKSKATIEAAKAEIEGLFEGLFLKADQNFRLNNEEIFEVSIGRRMLQKDILQNSNSGVPVYSANVFQPFGYTTKSLITDFEKDSVLWGIDGDWMVNWKAAGKPFYPTDHCGIIRAKKRVVSLRYLAWQLNRLGIENRFSRAFRASTDRVKGLTIKAPNMQEQEILALDAKIETLEQKISQNQAIINEAAAKKNAILQKFLN